MVGYHGRYRSLPRYVSPILHILANSNRVGSGTRLRDAVKVVTDGTLGLLSKSLPNKSPGYITSSNVLEDSKPQMAQAQGNGTNGLPSANNYNHFGDGNGPSNSTTAAYPATDGISHQQTPYPAATQYSTYPDSHSNTSGLTYSSQENQGFSNYQSSDSVEAPLLAAFAAQASQVAPNNWQRPHNPASQAWQQWTSTMAGNLEPQDCYSASALMQLGGRDLGNNENGNQPGSSITDMAVSQPTVMPDHGHVSVSNGGNVGATWPLNIFDMGHSVGSGS